MKQFPKGFFWGAATSSYQVEGGIENNDWAEAARLGRVPVAGDACDHYNRFEEDFDIAKSLGHNAHRFSIEWSRIEPEEGKFDEKEIEHYRKVVRALRARGMEPFVTLWHFTNPLWFSESGGWARADAARLFARYTARIAQALGDDVTFFITLNEPLIWLGEHALVLGARPKAWHNPLLFLRLFLNFVSAHKKAYATLKEVSPQSRVGVGHHVFNFESRGWAGKILASSATLFDERLFLWLTKGTHDFLGLQYYLPIIFGETKEEKEGALRSDIGWEIRPRGMYYRIRELMRYQIPIYITENGIADSHDRYREQFITDTLDAIRQALEEGADVRGYLHWSLLDNYEWWRGYDMRFGLVAVDYEQNQKRTVRPSARAYAEIIKKHREESP